MDDLQKRLDTWREWAQFVYGGGGSAIAATDDELRARVCAAHDAVVAEAEAAARELDSLRGRVASVVRRVDAHLGAVDA
jgi:hypothetical protein